MSPQESSGEQKTRQGTKASGRFQRGGCGGTMGHDGDPQEAGKGISATLHSGLRALLLGLQTNSLQIITKYYKGMGRGFKIF